jgi:hypothetical protein
MAPTELLCRVSDARPNNSFKPNLLRYSKSVAKKACHAFASTTQVGLTQALGAMFKFNSLLIASFLALASLEAAACSVLPEPPGTRFKDAHSVTLAVPLGNSIKPAAAKHPRYVGEAQQTIQWQVLVAWKGKYHAGDKLTTRQQLTIKRGTCQSLLRMNGEQPHLLYLFDREPYAEFFAFPPVLASDDLQYLEKRMRGTGNGT